MNWRSAAERHPFKAAAIRDDEDWVWLDDEPSEFDLADLNRRRQMGRLVLVNPRKPFLLMGRIRNELEERLARHTTGEWPRKLFSEGDLADFLIARWKLALTEVQAARLAGGAGGSPEALERILDRYNLRATSLLADFRIVEHGSQQDRPRNAALSVPASPGDFASYGEYLVAQKHHSDAWLKPHSAPPSYIIVEIPFEGDAGPLPQPRSRRNSVKQGLPSFADSDCLTAVCQ